MALLKARTSKSFAEKVAALPRPALPVCLCYCACFLLCCYSGCLPHQSRRGKAADALFEENSGLILLLNDVGKIQVLVRIPVRIKSVPYSHVPAAH